MAGPVESWRVQRRPKCKRRLSRTLPPHRSKCNISRRPARTAHCMLRSITGGPQLRQHPGRELFRVRASCRREPQAVGSRRLLHLDVQCVPTTPPVLCQKRAYVHLYVHLIRTDLQAHNVWCGQKTYHIPSLRHGPPRSRHRSLQVITVTSVKIGNANRRRERRKALGSL